MVMTEPTDPERHEQVLANLMRRVLNSGQTGIWRALSTTDMETLRIDLRIERQSLTLDTDEVAAIAVENNKTWTASQ